MKQLGYNNICCVLVYFFAKKYNTIFKQTRIYIVSTLAIASFATVLPLVSLPVVLPLVQFDMLMLLVGFGCLFFAYVGTRA